MYFIQRGLVKLTPPDNRSIQLLSDGMYFGETCILQSGFVRTVSAQALQVTHVYHLTRKEFYKVKFHNSLSLFGSNILRQLRRLKFEYKPRQSTSSPMSVFVVRAGKRGEAGGSKYPGSGKWARHRTTICKFKKEIIK